MYLIYWRPSESRGDDNKVCRLCPNVPHLIYIGYSYSAVYRKIGRPDVSVRPAGVFRRPRKAVYRFLKYLPHEENQCVEQEERHQNAERPGHVAEEAGHGHFALFGDGFYHEVGGVADVAERAHEDRTH